MDVQEFVGDKLYVVHLVPRTTPVVNDGKPANTCRQCHGALFGQDDYRREYRQRRARLSK